MGTGCATVVMWGVLASPTRSMMARFWPITSGSRLDVGLLVEEIANLILKRQEDERLKWYDDRRVRVFTSKVLPSRSAARQTLAGRRKRFRAALRERLVRDGWWEVRANVYARGVSPEGNTTLLRAGASMDSKCL